MKKKSIGIYYAYWSRQWDADFVPYLTKVKQLGFDILEVNAGTVANFSKAARNRLKDAAERAEIELTFCIGLTAPHDIASEDAVIRKCGIEFLKKQAKAVKHMNAKKLGGIIYGSWPGKLPPRADKRAFTDRSVKSMQEVMKTVEDCDVLFNVEVVNRFEQYMMCTCEEALEYTKRVGSRHCKILLDTFHMNIEEDSIYEAIVRAGNQLGHMHIGENNRRAPGRGHIPWFEISLALQKINYQGAVVMEPFLQQGGEVGRDISVYRDLRDGLDLDEEAGRACQFIRAQLG
jgi:D-psicose/D-tagatose/L-ribulose 3-epimerase